jgi:23S rRNA (cytosine1962-C5)-methyltransferase
LLTEIRDLIQQNLAAIKPYLLKNDISAFRLINNTPFLPLGVDIYQNKAVVHVFSKKILQDLNILETALKDQLNIKEFYYKKNSPEDFELPVSQPAKTILVEYGHKFLINLSDYLDTGLFLDHRETRRWVAGLSKNKIILNTFAYTGSFSVYAAAEGAAKTYSVDISRVYCEWIKENLALNNLSLEKNWVAKMDTQEFFKYAGRKNLVFDIIVIDPPTFSKNKGKSFSVQKDHPDLINAALKLLSVSGFILFSCNYHEFRLLKNQLEPCHVVEKPELMPPDYSGFQPHRCFVISKA